MSLRIKVRLIGMLILLVGFFVLKFIRQNPEQVDLPDIEATPQLEPEYSVNISEKEAQ